MCLSVDQKEGKECDDDAAATTATADVDVDADGDGDAGDHRDDVEQEQRGNNRFQDRIMSNGRIKLANSVCLCLESRGRLQEREKERRMQH